MAAKMSEARRRAFFAALAATGNRTLAAERAKVSRSWVRLHRSTDPAFRAEMEAAVAVAARRLDGASGVGPDGAWRAQAGEELAVRGCNGRWMQVARARLRQWTPRSEARFLSSLAASCNVKRACAEVGLSPQSAYDHRNRWPAFAEAWDVAIEEGYDRIATAIVASAGAMLGDAEMVPEAAIGPMTFDDALRTLGLHRRRATGEGRAMGRVRRVRSLDEMRPSILAKFEVEERAFQASLGPEERAARERELAARWGE